MWSHSINDGSIGGGESDTPQDSFCRACDKASSDDDIRQMFNVSAIYALPFKNRIWGNWELSAIGTAQTGLPVNITVDRSNSAVPGLFTISGEERPNYVSSVPLMPSGGSTPNNWINLAAFSAPANQTFGNLGRNAFRAPGISQLDLGLSKFISVTERLNLRCAPTCLTFSTVPNSVHPTPISQLRISGRSRLRLAARLPAAAHRANCSSLRRLCSD